MVDIQHLRADYLINKYLHLPQFSPVNLSVFHSVISILFIIFSITVVLLLIQKVLAIRYFLTEKAVLLEITPPAFTEKSAFTTKQLFSHFHTLGNREGVVNWLLGRKTRFSFEIASTYQQGIRYFVRTSEEEATTVKRDVISYLPNVKVKEVDDYLPKVKSQELEAKVTEYRLTKPFPYPLQHQDTLEEHDPVAYITGQMTKLSPGELLSYQIIASPIQTKETSVIRQKIIRGEDVLGYVNRLNRSGYAKGIGLVFKFISSIGNVFQWVLKTIINDFFDPKLAAQTRQSQYLFQYAVNSQIRPARVLTSFEQNAVSLIESKIDQNLFETRIRVLIQVKNKSDLKERIRGFTSSLANFSVSDYQTLKRNRNYLFELFPQYLQFNFSKRLLSPLLNDSPYLLSESEIADMYHFPFTRVTQTENIVKVHSKELPAPLSLKKTSQLDIEFAKNTYGGTTTMIGLTAEERRRHMYIIGATGTGKSTLLLSMITQDIQNGKGVAVVDPHGELAETILESVPKDRIKDVIYFNPDDLKYPIGLNLLELTPGLDEEDTLREKEFIAESVISLFRKVFSDAMVGNPHRIEYILRNTIHTAFTVENSTLFTIFDLLNDPIFQKKIVANLKDDNLKNFWKHEFGKAGDYQKVKMISPITARIGRFLFSPSAKRILEQTRSTINFDDILDSGKILVCNLSKGKLGEDTSQVLGIMILNKMQLASLKRARVKSSDRRDFYLYVDEFQNFATKSFIDILSESRKYKLNLTMAEQSTSQLRDKHLVHTILANAGTIISFKTANPEDEKLLLPQFTPYIEQGEIANLPAFHFYMKNSAINPEEPLSGETILIENDRNINYLDQIITSSRNQYTVQYVTKQNSVKEANNQTEKISKNVAKGGLPDN